VLGYDATETNPDIPAWKARQELTIDLARDFLRYHKAHRCRFAPLGVAQGWSPKSYARAVGKLQRMGYRYIAIGGLVPLKTGQITICLAAVSQVRHSDVQLHLLGVTRTEQMTTYQGFGVSSFDSTSPFRQAFKDDKDNYHLRDRSFAAIRVPQVDGNTRLKLLVQAGRIDQAKARLAERRCLLRLAAFDEGEITLKPVLDALAAYAEILEPDHDYSAQHRDLLECAPWKSCDCGLCEKVGIQICIFRGTERNKRRGFHNLHVFRQRLSLSQRSRRTGLTRVSK
jgi:hypothetical protein